VSSLGETSGVPVGGTPSPWSLPRRLAGILLVSPALAMVAVFFVLPLSLSIAGSFHTDAGWGLGNFAKLGQLYLPDLWFTLAVVAGSTLLIAGLSVAIAGYLTLGRNPWARGILRWLYRWPLFIPFIVAGQVLRTFLAKFGLMNMALAAFGLVEPMQAQGWYDWRGIVFAFAWKQTPFVTLLLAGAMAGLDRGTIEAARNLGASRLRILLDIVVPQVGRTLATGLILSVVTMMQVLSVPLMINAHSPTMLTADIAFRINSYGDYGMADAIGTVSLLVTSVFAILYLRLGLRETR